MPGHAYDGRDADFNVDADAGNMSMGIGGTEGDPGMRHDDRVRGRSRSRVGRGDSLPGELERVPGGARVPHGMGVAPRCTGAETGTVAGAGTYSIVGVLA